MMDDEYVLETEGRYRIRLVPDEDAQEPWGDYMSPVLRLEYRGGWWRGEHIDGSSRPRGNDNRIEEAISRWGAPSGDSWKLFERYLRAFHGVTQVEYWHSGSYYWYISYDSIAWREYAGAPPGSASLDEYKAWAEGDCWGWMIEQNVAWHTEDDFPDHDSWEHVDSCWGYFGDYAREAALEHWEAFMRDKREAEATTGKP